MTDMTLSHRVAARWLPLWGAIGVTLDPLPPAATHLILRGRGRIATIGHDDLGWWVRGEVGPAIACGSLYGTLCQAVPYLDEWFHK